MSGSAIYLRCVLFIFSAQYLTYVFNCIKQWRKNPKWSFSCLLALLLPLNELQGELSGMAVRNILTQQFHSGDIDMPSITKTLRETIALSISIEEEENQQLLQKHEQEKERTEEKAKDEKGQNKAAAVTDDDDDDDDDDDYDDSDDDVFKGKEEGKGNPEETILSCPLI